MHTQPTIANVRRRNRRSCQSCTIGPFFVSIRSQRKWFLRYSLFDSNVVFTLGKRHNIAVYQFKPCPCFFFLPRYREQRHGRVSTAEPNKNLQKVGAKIRHSKICQSASTESDSIALTIHIDMNFIALFRKHRIVF